MRSVTSCFNSTLYRKSITRFWPLWALYGLIWLFLLPLNLLTQYFDWLRWDYTLQEAQSWLLESLRDIPSLLPAGVFLSCLFGVLAAMAVFGYLYNSRSACMMHALPLRRESLFCTQYLAGLSFLLLPQLAAALLTLLVELVLLPTGSWGAALPALGVWLLVQSGTALFFYSFAAFCAMFTGHILALPAFYGILNCLVYVVSSLLAGLMSQFYYGYSGNTTLAPAFTSACTPLMSLFRACRWEEGYELVDGTYAFTQDFFLRSPGTVAAYAAAGAVFALLALLVYRCRHVESAGDVVAIPLVRPVFLVGVTFCSGLCLGFFTSFFLGIYESRLALSLCVLFWTAAGYFAAQMLLKKSFRVLHTWKGCVVGLALVAALCAVLAADLFGVEDRVPTAGQVSSVEMHGSFGYPYDSGDNGWSGSAALTDPGQIQQVIDLHQAIIREKDRVNYHGAGYQPGDDYISLNVIYNLSDGSVLERSYHSVPVFHADVNQAGSVTQAAQAILDNRELVARAYNFDFYKQGRLVEAYLDGVDRPGSGDPDIQFLDGAAGEDLAGLWQAVLQDFQDGVIGVRYLFDDQERLENTYRTDLSFSFEFTEPEKETGTRAPSSRPVSYTRTITITLTPNASRTLAWLEEMSALGVQYQLVPHVQSDSDWATPPEAILAY